MGITLTRKKKIIIIIAAVVLLAGVGVGAYFFFNKTTETDVVDVPVDPKKAVKLEASNVVDEAVQTQGAEAGQVAADKVIAETADTEVKAYGYILKSDIAFDLETPDTNLALKYAYEAEKLYPTFQSAFQISFLEQELSNQDTADKYFEIYNQRLAASGKGYK